LVTPFRRKEENRRILTTLMSNLPGMAYRGFNLPDCPMVFVSEGALALTGHPASSLTGEERIPFHAITHAEDRDRVWESIQEGIRENRPFTMTYRLVTRDGKEKWVWEQGRGVLDAHSGQQMVEGFITDITELKTLEQQLHQSQKMEAIGTLAGGVAHDFNNLLQAINGYADLALQDLAADHSAKPSVQEVVKAGDRASMLVKQLLAFSRRQVLDMREVDLNGVVHDVSNMLRRLLGPQVTMEI